jgi:hypothetical protein
VNSLVGKPPEKERITMKFYRGSGLHRAKELQKVKTYSRVQASLVEEYRGPNNRECRQK